MKTKLFFTLLLVAFTKSAFSQAYIPMLDNSSWNIRVVDFLFDETRTIQPGTNIPIGAYTYTKFIDPVFGQEIFLREDVTTRKVYRLVDGNDKLLFDFSVQNGDVVTLPNGFTYTVSVNTAAVNGGTRKSIHLLHQFFQGENWIEGVGSVSHPLMNNYEMLSDPSVSLLCSAQNGINVYNQGIAIGAAPTDCSMLATESFNSAGISFAPNPFQNQLTITTPTNLQNAMLKIFNALGQQVRERNNINGKEIVIERESLKSGIYFIQLSQNGNLSRNYKVIVTD